MRLWQPVRQVRRYFERQARDRRLEKLTPEQADEYSNIYRNQYCAAKDGKATAAARAKLEELRKKFGLTPMDAGILETRLASNRAAIEYALDYIIRERELKSAA